MTTALAVAAALVSFAFACSTHERWLVRRQRQLLAWSTSLLMFTAGASALAWGSTVGWSPLTFRLFFAFGAVLNVPFLALGQLYVQFGARRTDRIGAAVALLAAFSFGVVLVSPIRAGSAIARVGAQDIPQGSDVFGPWPRVLAAVGSGVGATVVFVGAVTGVVSALRAWRGHGLADAGSRALGLALIAFGTVVLSLSGVLNSVVGAMQAFSITLTVGVVLLFAGFVVSTVPSPPRKR